MSRESGLSPAVRDFIGGGAAAPPLADPSGELPSDRFETFDPSSATVLSRCLEAGAREVDQAIERARIALAGPWAKLTPLERGGLLHAVADLIERDRDEIAELEALDSGKPISVVRSVDVPAAIEAFRYFGGLPQRLEGQTIPVSTQTPFLNYTVREPVGVVAQIIPWNYPFLLAAWKLAPALACGNACILKPAEQSPLSAVWLGRLMLEAGLPEHVVTILTGGPDTGRLLAEHRQVDAVSFTGSTEVGRSILVASSLNLKRVGLELGGKSPNVVFDDADLDVAVPVAAEAVFYNAGQECAAGSRLLVHHSIHDEVVDRLRVIAESMRIGDALDERTEMGPLISETQREKVRRYLELGSAEGATLVTGDDEVERDGYYVRPAVFAGADNEMSIAREEIFGPVATVIPFRSEEEALRLANDTEYGLAAGVWTRDVSRAHRFASEVRAGMVWINSYNAQDPASPFGGFKSSGIGKEMGASAIDLYTELKSVWVPTDG